MRYARPLLNLRELGVIEQALTEGVDPAIPPDDYSPELISARLKIQGAITGLATTPLRNVAEPTIEATLYDLAHALDGHNVNCDANLHGACIAEAQRIWQRLS